MDNLDANNMENIVNGNWNDFVQYESLRNDSAVSIDLECETKEYHEEITYEWLIENFNPKFYAIGEIVQSKKFPSSNSYNFDQYAIRIYPKFASSNYRDETTTTVIKNFHQSNRLATCNLESSFYCPDSELPNVATNPNSCDSVTISIAPFKELTSSQTVHMKINISYLDSKNSVVFTEPIHNITFAHNTKEVRLQRLKKSDFEIRTKRDDKDLHMLFHCSLSANMVDENANNRCRLGFRSRSLLWNIRDYEKLFRDHYFGSFIESDFIDFAADQLVRPSKFNDHFWSLNLYPRGKDRQYEDSVSLFIKHEIDRPVIAICELRFYDEDRQPLIGYELPTRLFEGCKRWGIGDCFPVNDSNLLKRIECKNLIIECRIKMLNSTTTNMYGVDVQDSNRKKGLLHEERLFDLFKTQKYLDLCVIAREGVAKSLDNSKSSQNYSFLVHKVVFAAASELIEDLIDKQGGDSCITLELKDCPYECLLLLVAFLYKRRIEKYLTHKAACELIRVACVYDIRCLYDTLETYLIKNTANETIFDLISLFDMGLGLSNKLRQFTVDFIGKHSVKMLDTPHWKRLKEDKPDIVDTFLKVLLQKNNLEK
jgi:hypothetical protein